jgi:hypothetical protein
VEFHGRHDTPTFVGCPIVNNRDYAFVIDAGANAVRGMSVVGCYLADVGTQTFMHCVSGLLEMLAVSGSEIGYTTVALLVEAAFLSNSGTFTGCHIQGGGGSSLGVVQPNANSGTYLFVNNQLSAGNTLGTGAFASKAMNILAPTVTTQTVTTSLTIGANGNPNKGTWFTYFTANYAAGIAANSFFELDFSWALATTANLLLQFCVNGALAANSALVFTAYIPVAGTVRLRATNVTGTAVGAVSGTVLFELKKII